MRKFRSKLIFKIKTKQPFYALFRVSRGTLGRLEDAVSEFEKKKKKMVSLSFWFFQTKMYLREPYRQNYKTGNCLLPKDIF